ncbi:calnexin [Anthonomus grandis grandis]|uniref:calnexin n=1 Tax=Anthonomus grandis grandis TaxID=2921223 RepID=UPI0021669EA5|nr:calnexin [Anthonomus grandis grandis]
MKRKVFFTFYIFACLVIAIAQELDDEVTIDTVDYFPYESPQPSDQSKVYFSEHFDNPADFEKKWTKSEAKKENIEEDIAKYDGLWELEPPQKHALKGDLGLVLKSRAKHSAISALLDKPFIFKDKPLIVQYEVMLQDGQECGGAYLKLLTGISNNSNLKEFHDKTPYSIMFGPDKCGGDNKVHFIFKHKNPKNGSIEEKHCERPKERVDEALSDKLPHLYTLILRPDNTFDILIDRKTVKSGSLLEDFSPPVNPPAEIEDPTDKKPSDWDEREKIPDPNVVKPDDWDEDAPPQIVDESAVMPEGWLEHQPAHIPDPKAKKPEDWDTEMDGEWEAPLIENPICADAPGCGKWEPPLISNPLYKGKWRAPLIENPNYKGKWRPRKIPNPDYFEDKKPFEMQPITAVGFELWSISRDILFDNLIITEETDVAEDWASATFDIKRQKITSQSASVMEKVANFTNQYPYLWAVYILMLAVPVVVLIYVCQRKGDVKPEAEKKKTDEPTKDEEEPLAKATISELHDDEVEEETPENEEVDVEKNSDPDSEEDNEAVENEPAEGEGTRKRKVRKE